MQLQFTPDLGGSAAPDTLLSKIGGYFVCQTVIIYPLTSYKQI